MIKLFKAISILQKIGQQCGLNFKVSIRLVFGESDNSQKIFFAPIKHLKTIRFLIK